MTKATIGPDSSRLSVLFAPAHTLVDETQGGSEFHWPYKLIEALARDHGVRITALTIQQCIEHQPPGVQFVSVDPGGSLPTSNLQSLRFHLRCYAKARRILASGKRVDVVHHMLPFSYRATFNLLALRKRRGDPPIVIGPLQPSRSLDTSDETQVAARDFAESAQFAAVRHRLPLSADAVRPILSALQRRTFHASAALVAVSEEAAGLYGPLAGTTELTVIPPGVDTALFAPRAQAADGGHDRETRTAQILAVGYLVKRKAFDVLIRAVGELVKSDLSVRLRIVGDGPQRAGLQSLVCQLGLTEHVTLAGRVPHSTIVQEYQRADIFCSTSRHEGFATVSLEAMACGLPVVATPAGGFQELLSQGDAGTLVPFGAVDELASALAGFIGDRSLRESAGRRARQIVVQGYDWRIVAERYMRIYERITLRQENGRDGA